MSVFPLGIGLATNSVRALIVRCSDGAEFGSAAADYPSGHQGVLLDPTDHLLARQHPGDYLISVERAVGEALRQAEARPGFRAADVVGVGVDTTGSSRLPVNASNRALGSLEKWRKNLNAQCWP
jgi:L-ribulokinase